MMRHILLGSALALVVGDPVFAQNIVVPTLPGVSTSVANTWTANQTVQGLTGTSPGWYAQLTGDTFPRIHVGLNASDIASVSFGAGSGVRDLFLERLGAASLRMGGPDIVGTPGAQTFSVQGVATSQSNTAGADFNIKGSASTGNAVGGSIILQTTPAGSTGTTQNVFASTVAVTPTAVTSIVPITANSFTPSSATIPTNGIYLSSANTVAISANGGRIAFLNSTGLLMNAATAAGFSNSGPSSTVPGIWPDRSDTTTGIGRQATGNLSLIAGATEMMRITSTLITLPTIATDATRTDSSVCQDTTTHALYSGSGTLGICLGTSSIRYKGVFTPLRSGLATIMALRPGNYFYKVGWGDGGKREQYGFIAEDVVHEAPKLVSYDADEQPNTVDILGMVPIMVRAIQEQQVEIHNLQEKLYRMEIR